jgi:hypothetical protein
MTSTSAQQVKNENALHPAAQWALEVGFNTEQIDCTTAVVLKILDNKCKMSPGEKEAVMAIYDAIRQHPAPLFDNAIHDAINAACQQPTSAVLESIHQFRVHAEAVIPKPVMKSYKAFLRNGLFG